MMELEYCTGFSVTCFWIDFVEQLGTNEHHVFFVGGCKWNEQ